MSNSTTKRPRKKNTPTIERTCQQCGAVFMTFPYLVRDGNARYCSKKCTGLARRSRIEKQCLHCGKSFITYPCRLKDGEGKYCSNKCYGISKQDKVELTCIICGTVFKKPPSRTKGGIGKYCSFDCRDESRRGSRHPLWRGGNKRKFRGANWTRQRRLAYERDEGICQHCGKKPRKGRRGFDVHHIKPFHLFNGDYLSANQLTNLITLCSACHAKAECGQITIQPYLF